MYSFEEINRASKEKQTILFINIPVSSQQQQASFKPTASIFIINAFKIDHVYSFNPV